MEDVHATAKRFTAASQSVGTRGFFAVAIAVSVHERRWTVPIRYELSAGLAA